MGNHELAIRDFKTAIDIESKFPEALLSIGKSQMGIKDVYAAKESFDKAMHLTENPEI